jgi:CRISPR-associated protein Cas1
MDFLGEPTVEPLRSRVPYLTIERGKLHADEHCLLLDRDDGKVEIPVSAFTVILIEPGVSVTHAAIKLAAEHNVLLVWVGEAGVRVYSTGLPGGKSGERIPEQAAIVLDPARRMQAARRLYRLMFGEEMPDTRSLDKLRGLEGAKVKELYRSIAKQHGIEWINRDDAPTHIRDALGYATACLYGLAEAVILAAGYSPAIGIVHCGDPRSFVFDLADTVKFKTVVPVAFRTAMESSVDVRGRVRRACRA